MKKIILLTALCLIVFVGCKKADYTCHQTITTSMVPDSTGFPQTQFSEFLLDGSTDCIVGTTIKETPLNRNRVKVVKYETRCN